MREYKTYVLFRDDVRIVSRKKSFDDIRLFDFNELTTKLKHEAGQIIFIDTDGERKFLKDVISSINPPTYDFNLTLTDISVLKYYRQGNELCGFEGVHTNLYKEMYLDGDLELTKKGRDFIKTYPHWDSIDVFKNKVYVKVYGRK